MSHQHRHRTAGQNFACNATKDPFAETRISIRPEHDEIYSEALHLIQQRSWHIVHPMIVTQLDLDTVAAEMAHDLSCFEWDAYECG
jgi:hypothetical protein